MLNKTTNYKVSTLKWNKKHHQKLKLEKLCYILTFTAEPHPDDMSLLSFNFTLETEKGRSSIINMAVKTDL